MQRHTDEIVALVRLLAEHESPTAHDPAEKAASDHLATYLEGMLTGYGAEVERLPQAVRGDHLVARWGQGERPTLILAHYDTVWPLGTLNSMPVRVVDDQLRGPGVYDMKGGFVLGLMAVRCLREMVRLHGPVTFLINSDEEVGSLTSRSLIESEARRSQAALVLEPAQPPNAALKTSRKGVGRFHLKVIGQPGHSGWVAEYGVSAVEEMARQVVDLYGLADHGRGTTINVGVMQGGTRANVIAAEAVADIDLRVTNKAEGERMTEAILNRQPFNPGAKIEVSGGLNRPPMERTPGTVALFEAAQRVGESLGLAITESSSGGGSDGNFTSAIGVPTLDGLGVVGGGAHGHDEHLLVSQLAARAALVAGVLEAVTSGRVGLP
ncbi:MAG: M20 family metallopeptidase [Anaerolineae bacterium]|nr:M20 family metallopeptidase [Anaerolineae bacterium]